MKNLIKAQLTAQPKATPKRHLPPETRWICLDFFFQVRSIRKKDQVGWILKISLMQFLFLHAFLRLKNILPPH